MLPVLKPYLPSSDSINLWCLCGSIVHLKNVFGQLLCLVLIELSFPPLHCKLLDSDFPTHLNILAPKYIMLRRQFEQML